VTNQQLYLAIGVPIIPNTVFNGIMFLTFSNSINKRFDDAKEMWHAELRRFEEVLAESFMAQG
jgi:hypothetical protein